MADFSPSRLGGTWAGMATRAGRYGRSSLAGSLVNTRRAARSGNPASAPSAKATLAAYQKSRNQQRKAAAMGGRGGGVKHRPAGSSRGGQFY